MTAGLLDWHSPCQHPTQSSRRKHSFRTSREVRGKIKIPYADQILRSHFSALFLISVGATCLRHTTNQMNNRCRIAYRLILQLGEYIDWADGGVALAPSSYERGSIPARVKSLFVILRTALRVSDFLFKLNYKTSHTLQLSPWLS